MEGSAVDLCGVHCWSSRGLESSWIKAVQFLLEHRNRLFWEPGCFLGTAK